MGIFKRVSYALGNVVSFVILLFAVLTAFEVFMRYVVNRPTTWSLEITEFLFVLTIWLGAGYAQLKKGHVNMDVVFNLLPPAGKKGLGLIDDVLCLVYAVMIVISMTWEASRSYIYGYTSETSLKVPYFPIQSLLVIGSLLLLFMFLNTFLEDLHSPRQADVSTVKGESR